MTPPPSPPLNSNNSARQFWHPIGWAPLTRRNWGSSRDQNFKWHYIRVAARKLMTDLVNGGEVGEPENKRARLESVVPVPAPATAKKKNAAKSQPQTSPPRPVPPPTPLWLSGQLPPSQRGRGTGRGSGPARGSGHHHGSGHQGGPSRGAASGGSRGGSGGNRGANNGQWRPPRGGQYGRWGRW